MRSFKLSRMNETDSLEADNIEVKEEFRRHESNNDWDDLGIDFENASQTVSTNESSNTPKARSNLDEVIDSVIQDAIDYADASPEKRILPKLVRKSTKSRSKQMNNNNNIGNNINSNFSPVQNHQMTTNNHTANNLMTQTIASSNTNNVNSIHPLMQANFGHPNMQQMAAQLQLAASGKSISSSGNSNSSLMQHNMLGSAGVTNNQTQQQQLTAAMMGFGTSQIPNMMMPTYNGNVPITYHQQMASGQYHLPVTFAQIQQLHQQQQQQQTQQHQQSQSHILLNNNPNSSEMTSGNNSQQSSMNFATGSNTNPQQQQQQQQQQSMLPTSYPNFSNQTISVSPYQIPGMMHAFASPPGSAGSGGGTQIMTANQPSASLLNGVASNNSSNSRYLSSNNSSNVTNSTNNNNQNTNITQSNNTNIALSSNNNNSSNTNISNGNASTITAASMASLYQQLPQNTINSNPFDFHQQQLLYNQRLLQAQQQQQQQQSQQQQQTTNNINNVAGILADYSVSRYGGGGGVTGAYQ